MGFFQKFFSKNKTTYAENAVQSEELKRIRALDSFMTSLLGGDHYVAKSEYREKLSSFSDLADWFKVLKDSGSLNDYCKRNGVSVAEISAVLSTYSDFEALVDSQNERYIEAQMIIEKDYLDSILKESDPNIVLDDDQRRVVLTDEDYCLVVAGAGAGKTTTVAAKVKYLVDKQGIDPKQILVISFTNKAVNELKERIIGDLHIECPIATFHSTGNAVIHKHNPDKLNIVDSNKLYYVVQDYLRESVLKNETAVNNLILFFASYFDAPYEGKDLNAFFNHIAKSNFTTIRSELDDFKQQVIDARTKKAVTIQSEMMRSNQEVEIANFLYLNGIEYEYEPMYRYDILFARKPYTPDFRIWQGDHEAYLEHFGITEDGRNNRYSEDELETYKKAVVDKIKLHRQHNTQLLYTFSAYKDRRSLTEHLREQLEAAGFELRPRSNKEVLEKLVISEENRYVRKLVALIQRFITNFKTNGYTADEFNRMYHSTQNVRTRLFLNICNDCYLEYERYLKDNQAVDFQDMINESARILREVKEMRQKLNFRYIIVDEYQDISRQRFDLVAALHDVTDAKIIAVGDDWQSIYAFSGSDISLFTKFREKMGYAALLKIVRTYRNSQEVIDIAGSFIQKNSEQIQKDLISPKHIEDPVIVYTYDSRRKDPKGDNRSGVNYAIAHAIETALEQIMEYNREEGKPVSSSILLLGRFGFDGDRLEKSGLFEYITRGGRIKSVKYPKLNITFMTAHSSKGLGYDNVIVVNGRNETYGFPSKIEDDPVLAFVVKEDLAIEYAEERRLFYVAMTRTKNRVFFIAPEQNPSEFLLELKHDFKNVVLRGNWNEDPTSVPSYKKTCPMCGYPMQFRYKSAYGLRLHICTNEPEVCGFMTNNAAAGKLSIIKCDRCRDGYLIVKPGNEKTKYMLGCTNYKKDGTGCSRTMTPKYFYTFMNIEGDELAPPIEIPKGSDIKPKTQSEYPDAVTEQPIEEKESPIQALDVRPIEYNGYDLNVVLQTILQALSDVSKRKYYGETMLADVLRGSKNKRIIKDRLDRCDVYGRLSYIKRNEVQFLIEWLIQNEYILQTKGPYPVLHPTYNGQHFGEVMTRQKLQALKRKMEADSN
ncbi:MAG: UvrD-helicase domain-containing protein [Oscillospiraceae bacterium]|nr:UvrD-helicase domain-containing protein [Oscillospiraceae bacterium]